MKMVMKKFFVFTVFIFLISIIFINNGANARGNHHIDHSSPYLNVQKFTVRELKSVHDDEYVVLEGYIVKKIKNETYLFRDSTGEIKLDIDNDINYLLKNVNERTLVEISGEYERNTFEPDEIEVENIKILKQE